MPLRAAPSRPVIAMRPHTPLTLVLLSLAAVLAVPAVQSQDLSQAVLDCSTYYWDTDGDGHYEAWSTCSTPECGCMCPVAGGLLTVTAAGQEKSFVVFASCQSGYGQGTEDAPDPAKVGVAFTPIVWGV